MPIIRRRRLIASAFLAALVVLFVLEHLLSAQSQSSTLLTQSPEDADRKSAGCLSCHSGIDEPTMHPTRTVRLGCTDCHGGDASASVVPGTAIG